MNPRITIEVVKLPSARKNVSLFQGDTIGRALVEAFGDDSYNQYTIVLNGVSDNVNLQTPLSNGDCVTISRMVKGNNLSATIEAEVKADAETVEVTEEIAVEDAVEVDAEEVVEADETADVEETDAEVEPTVEEEVLA